MPGRYSGFLTEASLQGQFRQLPFSKNRSFWTCTSRTFFSSTQGRPKNVTWISAGTETVPSTPVKTKGMDIETVDSYKHLGVDLNNKLDWQTTSMRYSRRFRAHFTCSGDLRQEETTQTDQEGRLSPRMLPWPWAGGGGQQLSPHAQLHWVAPSPMGWFIQRALLQALPTTCSQNVQLAHTNKWQYPPSAMLCKYLLWNVVNIPDWSWCLVIHINSYIV